MCRDKQIEEMAKVLKYYTKKNNIMASHVILDDYAEALYTAGYRKQSEGEWVRYPHGSGIYCSLCKRKRRHKDIKDSYCPNCGAKMKGGAE